MKPYGKEFKEKLTEPGPWRMSMTGMGECLPYYENQVALSKDQKDEWDMPLLEIQCEFRENELNMLKDLLDSAGEMLDTSGFKNIVKNDSKEIPGMDIHEMGTARMGKDPKTSILNGFNQIHAARNIFLADGACMTSSGCQNPSITYMALTARAANYAVSELKKRNL